MPVRLEYKEGDTYSFRIDDDSYKGLEQVARELGWWTEGMRTAGRKKKTRISRGDIFVVKQSQELVRVMTASKEHRHFFDFQGKIVVRPFLRRGEDPHYTIRSGATHDFEAREVDLAYVRPSSVTVITGSIKKATGLSVGVDVLFALNRAVEYQGSENPAGVYVDENGGYSEEATLKSILSAIPMFADELPLVEQSMVDFGNAIEPSPIVHPEIAGCGVEYAHGRAAHYYANKCEGRVAEMEKLCRDAYGARNIPRSLNSKYCRRADDYQRSYRMGVLSSDLEKMREEIKTHRNMLDYHDRFLKSKAADDETDRHILNRRSISRILPQKLHSLSQDLSVPVFPRTCTIISDHILSKCVL